MMITPLLYHTKQSSVHAAADERKNLTFKIGLLIGSFIHMLFLLKNTNKNMEKVTNWSKRGLPHGILKSLSQWKLLIRCQIT